jgi:hypothetical protein
MNSIKFAILSLACAGSCAAFAQRQNNPYDNVYSNPKPYTPSQGTGYANPDSHTRSGYVRQDGTYVAPSHATNPNSTRSDNYSTKGNVNPYTGKAGTKY